MVQDIYLAVVECSKCRRRFILKSEYPSRVVEPFGTFCNCNDATFYVQGNALTSKEWFAQMELKEKRGR